MRDSLTQILPLADELGVTLALEPMHHDCAAEWTFLTCLDEVLGVIESIAHPRLKLAFDTYHLGFDPKVLDRIGPLVPHIAVVHLGDGRPPRNREQNRCRLGEGEIPLRPIVAAANRRRLRRFVRRRIDGSRDRSDRLPDLLSQSKRKFAELIAS